LRYGVLAVCAVAVVYAVALEPYQIPTGSMAPALYGHHRVCACPRCGQQVIVGRAVDDPEGSTAARYPKAFCPNCGLLPIPVQEGMEVQGNRILVNKTAFLVRAPRRWEVIVFRLLGTYYIKRLLGLPGDEILIRDGDVYVNGQLLRKSLEEARALRMRVFAQENVPEGRDGKCRWESTSGPDGKRLGNNPWDVAVDGRTTPQTLTYGNYLFETDKYEPLRDEYAYNAGLHADSECVHDFMIETEVEVKAGRG
jgi:signal peptidase I